MKFTNRSREAPADAEGQAVPDTPTQLSGGSWLAAARRSIREFRNDFLQDHAAALTYYGVLSIFPGILVLVSLLGLMGRSATQPLITSLANAAPDAVRRIFLDAATRLQSDHTTAGILALVGIAVGLWSASGYIAAFMRVSNAIYDVPEGRPFWITTPIRLGLTLAVAVLLAVSALIVVVTGGLAYRVGQAMGLGSVAVTIWDIAKWPVLLILVSLMIAILFGAEFNAELERGRAVAAGVPLGKEPFAEMRDTRKLRKAAKRGGQAA